jgi:pimeloyl-ACP methyl ester carboxylesterase
MHIQLKQNNYYAYTGGKPFNRLAAQEGKPTIVFLHGAQHDHSVWILQSRYLSHHGFPVLAFDLPAHGRSPGPMMTSIEGLATWLLESLEAVGVAHCVLVGHSMGSLIAAEATHQAKQRLAATRNSINIVALALVSCAMPMPVSSALLDATRDQPELALNMINNWSHSALTHQPATPGPGFSVFIQNLRLMQRQLKLQPGLLHNDFLACNAYQNGEIASQSMNIPCLILTGSEDQMTPLRSAKIIHKQVPHASLVLIPQAGHALMTEKPRETLAALLKFINTLPVQAQ